MADNTGNNPWVPLIYVPTKTARQIVFDYVVGDGRQIVKEHYSDLEITDVVVVSFTKMLQHWKALVTTSIPDGRYYEVTCNGDTKEIYIDVYTKIDHIKQMLVTDG